MYFGPKTIYFESRSLRGSRSVAVLADSISTTDTPESDLMQSI